MVHFLETNLTSPYFIGLLIGIAALWLFSIWLVRRRKPGDAELKRAAALQKELKKKEKELATLNDRVAAKRAEEKVLLDSARTASDEELIKKTKLKEELEGIRQEILRLEPYIEGMKEEVRHVDYLYERSYGKRETVEKELKDLESKIAAALAEQKRKAMEGNYYRLNLSEVEISEVLQLLQIATTHPRISEALKGALFSAYFAAETNSMSERVLGKGVKTGVYKITNVKNGFVYVGQSVDVRKRWRQHIKRGLGAEAVTQNLLYPAMQKDGVWNFSFELIEECDKKDLNEREKYWQTFYLAKEDYSVK